MNIRLFPELEPLTERQEAVLDCLVRCWLQNGCPPTIRDICSRLGISSTHAVHKHLRALVRKGRVEVRTPRNRMIYVPIDRGPVMQCVSPGQYLFGISGPPRPVSWAQARNWLIRQLGRLDAEMNTSA